jgi:hypothetical protein
VLAAEPGIAELLVAWLFCSVAFAFGFTGWEYEGEAADEALLEGCVVLVADVLVADWSAAVLL